MSGTALDRSNGSFLTSSDSNTLTISFGVLAQGSAAQRPFSISNLLSASGFTAGLDLDSFSGTGNTVSLFTNISLFSNLAAGNSMNFFANLDTSTVGSFSAQYTFRVSDENIPGAAVGTNLVLALNGSVVAMPEPSCALFLVCGALVLTSRRRA